MSEAASNVKKKQASVVLVGCGCPLKSMGWYHAVQILDGRCPSAALKYVVEPWYMSPAGRSSPGSKEFDEWRQEVEGTRGLRFFASVKEVPHPPPDDEIRMGIISARTADNPKLLRECIAIGCKSIYLEKPGAPSVEELSSMRDEAAAAGVSVLMGFNKNVSSYVVKARKFAADHPGAGITFLHNNAYKDTEEELGECFERNSEGMLKNMAIHELALLVTYYGVTVENIASVSADKEYSSCKTLRGPSGKEFTDFSRLKFMIKTNDGEEASVAADRCGGDDSVAIVADSSDGKELFRAVMPDEAAVANTPNLERKYPGAMPYFFAQDPDYLTLKERVAANCVDPAVAAEGVANIEVAVETLRVAEHLTPLLQDQLLG